MYSYPQSLEKLTQEPMKLKDDRWIWLQLFLKIIGSNTWMLIQRSSIRGWIPWPCNLSTIMDDQSWDQLLEINSPDFLKMIEPMIVGTFYYCTLFQGLSFCSSVLVSFLHSPCTCIKHYPINEIHKKSLGYLLTMLDLTLQHDVSTLVTQTSPS